MAKTKRSTKDLSTEEKIKAAASQVFTRKGYAATRTRDIAEAAGINLALLNYYFRSKAKLFELIMAEKMVKFFGHITPVFNDTTLTFEEKIGKIVDNYFDLLSENPDLPIFVLNEIRNSPQKFIGRPMLKQVFDSEMMKEIVARRPDLHPIHTLINTMSLIIFPFVMKPVIEASGLLTPKGFQTQMAVRREMIPRWIKSFLKT